MASKKDFFHVSNNSEIQNERDQRNVGENLELTHKSSTKLAKEINYLNANKFDLKYYTFAESLEYVLNIDFFIS
jgi:hypothetical protein